MSQVRIGATCLLVRAMFRNRQVRQAQMQGMRWKRDDHSLPECSLTQAEAFSNLDDLRPSGSLKDPPPQPDFTSALDDICGHPIPASVTSEVITQAPTAARRI